MVKTCKNYEAGLTPLLLLVALAAASVFVAGGGFVVNNLTENGFLKFNASIDNLLYKQADYLNAGKVNSCLVDEGVVGTVVLPDGSFSAYRFIDGGVKDTGNSYEGEVKIEFLSGDNGLGTYADGAIAPFYLKDGTKTAAIVMDRMVANLQYQNTSYPVKILQGTVRDGRLIGDFIGQTFDTGYIIGGKVDASGKISGASVTSGASRATEAQVLIAKNALLLFKQFSISFDTRYNTKVLAASATSPSGYQVVGFNKPLFDSNTGTWMFASPTAATTGVVSTAPAQNVVNYLQALNQGQQGAGAALTNTIYQYLPTYLQPAAQVIQGLNDIKSTNTRLTVSTLNNVATLGLDLSSITASISDGAITPAKLSSSNSASNGQCLTYNSSTSGFTWGTCGTSGGSGTITGVTAGNGLTGGGTTGAISLAVDTTDLSTCTSSSTQKVIWDSTNNRFTCGTDQTTGGSASSLSSITNAISTNTLSNGDLAQIWNWSLTTAGKTAFKFGESSASTATGTPYILGISTLTGSTANPLLVTAGGTSNGVKVDTTGLLSAIGTGGIQATTLNGATFAAPGAIGGTTPSTGAFTTLSATGAITGPTATNTINGLIISSGALSGITTISTSSTINGATISGGTLSGGSVLGGTLSGTALSGTGSFTLTGGTAASETLTLVSTSNVTKGDIQFFSSSNKITSAGALTIAGALSASNFSGSSSGTNTGDQTITLTSDVTGTGTGSFATTISSGAVTLAKMANLAANSIIGNNTGVSATPLALTASQVKTLLAISNTDVSGLGTIATQNSNSVTITGGSINGTTLGATTPGTGAFTTLSATSYATVSASLALGNTAAAAGPGHLNISGNLTTGGSINGLTINSGAVSGVSTLGLSGAITGATATNTINGLIINSGALSGITTINASGQITSTLATGTAPFVVASTTNVANLNASSLSGATFAAPGSIGSGTPGTGAFTTLSASSTLSANGGLTIAANQGLTFTSGTGTLTQNYSNTTGTSATINHTNSASSGTNTSTGLSIAITGTNNAAGSNTITGINFPNVTAKTNNTYNALTFGTGFNNFITSGTANLTAAGALSGLTTLGLSGAITGATATNTINGLIINSGALSGITTINASGQFTSTLATGTAPFVVASTTNVANLNASSLNGATFAAPGAIGGTTPGSGAFTTLSASGQITSGFTGNNAVLYGTTSTGVLASATTSTSGLCLISGAATGYVPTWTTCPGGGGSWSQLTAPGADLSLAMAATHTTFTWGGNTGAATDMFKLTDNATNTGTGYILDVAQVAGSAAKPLKVTQGANTLVDTTSGGVLTLTSAGAATWGTTTGNLTFQVAGTGTTGNVQIGAGGGGSATPDFLVVDQATGALPAGTNGAIALDSTGKFNIYEGAWKVLCNKSDLGCGTGSGAALSGITAATTGNTINSGDNAQVWNWQLSTAAKTAFSFSENLASINGAGSQYILGISTLTGSTANPLIITAGGTANGVKVDTTGLLSAIGTGGIRATDLAAGTYANALTLSSTSNALTGTIGQSTALAGSFTSLSATSAITAPTATNTINGLIISSGALSGITTINASGQITSTLATGTAPFVVASTTNVANLNASSLGGATFAAPGAIGGTTPGSGAFTTLSASSTLSANGGLTIAANQNLTFTSGTGTTTQNYSNTTGTAHVINFTNSGSSGTNTSTAMSVAMTGTANAAGSNTLTGLNFPNVAAATNNTYNGITFGTGFNNYLTSGTVNLTAAGALSGITTLGLSGAITGATATNTINGIIINSGAVSGVSTLGLSGAITGATATNTINGLIISSGALSGITTINASGQFTSTLATGTAPFVVASTTNVANLNASSLGGATFAAPGAIGGGTPGSGAFTTLSASSTLSANGGLTIAANQGLTFTSGTGTATQNYSNTTGTANTLNVTNSGSSGTNAVIGKTIAITGTINGTGTNTTTGINFANVAAATNNTYNGITFGTGFNNYITSGTVNLTAAGALSGVTTLGLSGAITGATATNTINGLIISSGALSGITTINASGQFTSTVTTGTAPFVVASTTNVANLNASSLNGATFAAPGAIGGTTPSTITGTTLNGTTGINTGAGAGTQRIDATGNLVGIGNITGTGAIILNTTGNTNGVTINTATGASGNSGAITIQTGGTSVSGTSGNITIDVGAGAGGNGTIGIGTANSGTITIGRSTQGITLPGFTGNNAVLYGTTGTGVLAAATTSTSGLCLVSGAATGYVPTWTTCPGGGGGIATVKEGGTSIVTTATSANFAAADFIITDETGGQAGIAIDYPNSKIIRSSDSAVTFGAGITFNTTGNTNGVTINTATGASGNSGAITIQTGGTSVSGTSGNVSIDVGAGAGGNGTVAIGGTNASGLTVGRATVTTTVAGTLSSSGGISLAANQGLTFVSGTGTLTQNYSNTTGTQATFNHTNSASSGTNTSAVLGLAITGTANVAGSNTITGINFPNVAAATNNTYNGITFGTGFNNYLTSGTVNLTAAGALSGLTTLGLSGAITGATATNTINGIIINSGAVSGVSTLGLSGAITGATATNTINGLIINSGALSGITTINASGQFTSTVTTGTAPFVVASTTNVANLNASSLGGATFAAPGAIGGGTPGTGAFTTLSATGAITGATVTNTINGIIINSGAVSSVSTLGLSGAITGATATNTINGVIINSGALSGVTGLTFSSGNITGAGTVGAGATTITSASTTALAVGANGITNPVLQVDTSTASVATGLKILGAATGGTTALSVIDSGTNASLSLSGKGSGTVTLASGSTGNIQFFTSSNSITSGGNLTIAGTMTIGTSGAIYATAARPTRQVTLAPEYTGAVLTGTGVGTMTSDFCAASALGSLPATNTSVCNTAGDTHNYYNWTTSQGTAQSYDIWIKWRVPDNFVGWATSNPVKVYAKTSDITNGKVNLFIYGTNNTVDANANNVNMATSATAWVQTNVASLTGTYTAGSFMTIRINMNAAASGGVSQVGEITLDYLTNN